MSYEVLLDVSKEVWEAGVVKFDEANFLQSWNWGVFHEALGKTVIRLMFTQDEASQFEHNVVGIALLVVERAKRGNYITIAGGPIFDWNNDELFSFIFSEIKAIAQKQGVDFIRFRPQVLDSAELRQKVNNLLDARPSPMHLTADLTLQLDLSISDEELLSQMRKNHRSSIKKCETLGITVEKTSDPSEIKSFYDHQLYLAEKHGFVPFNYEFLYEQFKSFSQDDQVLLFHSYQEGKLLASAFIIFYNFEAVYHYGISTEDNAKLPGSYACQWAAIQEAKSRGFKRYNFWGIAPEDAVNHRFAGVTMFKRGFGGQEVEYLHAHDIPLSYKYNLTASFEFLRKKMRRL